MTAPTITHAGPLVAIVVPDPTRLERARARKLEAMRELRRCEAEYEAALEETYPTPKDDAYAWVDGVDLDDLPAVLAARRKAIS